MRNRKVMLIGLGIILGTCLTVIIVNMHSAKDRVPF